MITFLNPKRDGERNIFSDLACERRRADTELDGVTYKKVPCPIGSWEKLSITSEDGAKSIGRPCGNYDTLNTKRLDLIDFDTLEDGKEEIARELCELFDKNGASPERLLVVGLGNKRLTPDAIGPLTASMVRPTKHIRDLDAGMFYALECSEISVITPGVRSESGMESAVAVTSICKSIEPTAVIAIDALASRSPERLGATVQICDTGIFPGTGIGRGGMAINSELLGVPVFAIGVPTVMDSRLFSSDADTRGGMFVSPKDIDSIVKTGAMMISGGINQAFGIDFSF